MSRSKQLTLPGFEFKDAIAVITRRKGEPVWYYVVNRLRDEMLALDDDGNRIWLPNDTIRYTPHLFTPKQSARNTAKTFTNSVVVKYRWPVNITPGRST